MVSAWPWRPYWKWLCLVKYGAPESDHFWFSTGAEVQAVSERPSTDLLHTIDNDGTNACVDSDNDGNIVVLDESDWGELCGEQQEDDLSDFDEHQPSMEHPDQGCPWSQSQFGSSR